MEMLELPKFGHKNTSTIEFDLPDKILFVARHGHKLWRHNFYFKIT